jgi:hypothetical protein
VSRRETGRLQNAEHLDETEDNQRRKDEMPDDRRGVADGSRQRVLAPIRVGPLAPGTQLSPPGASGGIPLRRRAKYDAGSWSRQPYVRGRGEAATRTRSRAKGTIMTTTRHFGVLIPSTNTTVEIECRLLPSHYQAHIGRLMTSRPGQPFSPSRDDDIDYQSRLLGTAKVEMVVLAQTSASLFADDYDAVTKQRMSAGAGVPAITSAEAVGRAVRALDVRRIGLVSPYSAPVNDRAARYFADKHGMTPSPARASPPPIPT